LALCTRCFLLGLLFTPALLGIKLSDQNNTILVINAKYLPIQQSLEAQCRLQAVQTNPYTQTSFVSELSTTGFSAQPLRDETVHAGCAQDAITGVWPVTKTTPYNAHFSLQMVNNTNPLY
jgi:hypothetical protein